MVKNVNHERYVIICLDTFVLGRDFNVLDFNVLSFSEVCVAYMDLQHMELGIRLHSQSTQWATFCLQLKSKIWKLYSVQYIYTGKAHNRLHAASG